MFSLLCESRIFFSIYLAAQLVEAVPSTQWATNISLLVHPFDLQKPGVRAIDAGSLQSNRRVKLNLPSPEAGQAGGVCARNSVPEISRT
jgi:hypothetical protein